ncbi:hypothetical protein L6452_03387 [Arctium lappa]|uniref:Uncharacterized protein n=1 Tax=Arctium lappa TaxID=4217 RepID=A0ACB9FML0_ARCLA|nr:hypothetical protein L6452_03387 [Arctium lappa]
MMNTTEEWKSLWTISLVHSPPLLLSSSTITTATRQIGPLIFKPQSHHDLFTSSSIIAFFPSGPNSYQVGFVVLSIEDSRLKVRGDYGETEVFTSKNASTHRIVKIYVSPFADCDCTSGDFCDSTTIGYLLVSTYYFVHYYSVRIRREDSGIVRPGLELLGNKLFKSCAIVHACWSPHLSEESLVLLESGDLFLFDLDSCSEPSISSLRLTGKKVKVLWDESLFNEKGGWFSCNFSWHSRVLIVVHSSVVFLVDLRSEKYNGVTLLKLGAERVANDRFFAFSVVAPDRFYFTLASNHILSELRSLSEDVTFSWASEAGYGILLGSFWNSEFSLFCYGPDVRGFVPSETSVCGKYFYAWGLTFDLSLVTRECGCGSCIVKEDFSKDRLPNWINWQQKKEFVLGFVFLDKEISSQLFEPDRFSGFTLVTLTSLGNFELHSEEEYKFRKVFRYLKLEWLDGYLKSDLGRILVEN